MNEQSYFTFNLSNRRFGIDAAYIDEVFALPELTPTSKTSYDIVGSINLRGTVIPVMDLNLSLSGHTSSYQLTDSLIVLKWKELRVGIIVNSVHDVQEISPEKIIVEPLNELDRLTVERRKIVAGVVKGVEELVILSNPENWLLYAETQQFMPMKDSLGKTSRDNEAIGETIFKPINSDFSIAQEFTFCSEATLEEREIFKRRAENLRTSTATHDLRNLRPLVVVILGDDVFGIDIEMVREFIDIRRITPVPSSPKHIIGNMNLRGEILTLIDIRQLFNPHLKSETYGSKAMVIEVENIVSGVIVEEICDVMFLLNPKEIVPVENAVRSNHPGNSYLQGVAPYHGRTMGIFNLLKMFQDAELIVDEVI
ncbi:MAG: chemotaxis protein CheW [Leptolyngbyaceae cyanobacterium SM1_4_3]|nr:chemotaxis protein CheW [Leptolyngbyaceae cyanobacterium SM1_4_3]